MIKLAIVAALVAVAVPTSALAAAPGGLDRENASRFCKAQRLALGAEGFRALYAPTGPARAAHGKCVSRTARAQAAHRSNAAKDCRAEQTDEDFAASHDGKTFAQFYGPGRNAFGRCVSSKATASSDAEQRAIVRAGARCRAERDQNPAAFRTKYGTGPQKANAFGRCVAGKTVTP